MWQEAPAKINLTLHVLGKRDDGYHLLDSLVVFTDAGDRLEAVKAPGLSLGIQGPHADALDARDNSVLQAARRLAENAGLEPNAALTLHKYLPVASGIGGGSSDAAAALHLLARLWDLRLDGQALRDLASPMGADIPACLEARTLHMSGIGERIGSAPALPLFWLVLANPGLQLATANVFAAYAAQPSEAPCMPDRFAALEDFLAFLRATRNDLESPALSLVPEIGAVLAALLEQPGCLLARMSGSGATCFGIFAKQDQAAAACIFP